ncbi:1,4-dihydroxy-2-naphthoate octaprenyltransferase [Parabacteroides sp. PF5-5]|uniref:1,4-dihydroxy-2-naphthoate octaprenyltransferase n=1 Tax=unclassified Parabacteroides TaxID=2649774 RepID=UPI0024764C55|nr:MULTISPECIES: 1,4-dihydroxy-2-naphthoate octaprenyltransferase [unclassified Parabacteroides]MDH6303749.1 1,4-dihydroxy-2-naphthoate octaprenyltransferase [Parabacteroides sp. PH5-39]MDH6314366.1 1,4-dihydroxy-2-naphthoate octaprenyltransferase [Parabacteroides sp. PF5-13]MDH6318569.1 1,4-dihydroxy-2-naphthoate octaprenyltransferase [Parabacteroides sp. PH5-13]MDH6322138.1 1,4-dihydroxy-2-naphthoate octaprenyltransferase [Parabacteroides sp. PH5-8]MDH6325782.1 1,4-dihydroxy-2-naphthoate oct
MIRYWILAARPRTLTASVSPVLLGCALAYRDGVFKWQLAVLCLLVALFAQIASNLANDYFDYKKGADGEDRLGPERAVASGWISPRAMLKGTLLMLGLACVCGLGVLYYAGWELIFVGIAIAVCVLAYSADPFPLAYNGLGDVCVLLFYGIIPVCFTYYVQATSFSLLSFLLSLSVGFLSINILIVNNYRDYEQDKASKKRTSIVLFGRTFGKIFYLANGILALLLILPLLIQVNWWMELLFATFFLLFWSTWQQLSRLQGRELNKTLGHTARNVLLFTLLLIALLLIPVG